MNGSDHLADLDVDGKIILKWILMKYGVRAWSLFSWSRME
jgi:hypothetical protein